MRKQDQFLEVIDRDEAERRFQAVLDLSPLPAEDIPLQTALGRVLAENITAPVDVPGFDRANVDGFAVRAEDTYGASDTSFVVLRMNGEMITPGMQPVETVEPGSATFIATGGVVPRGADAVVMVEFTDVERDRVIVRRAVAPGANISFAGTDIGRGETVLWRHTLLTSRETGVLAAIGIDRVSVVRKPRVAIFSTGDELIPPGTPMTPGMVYDSNAVILADAVRELGAEPILGGILPDDPDTLESNLRQHLDVDVVLLSGGTSKGAGDISYRVVSKLGQPGIVAHGIALKPGKPLCLAAVNRPGHRPLPIVILPGFPTSAIFTFQEFVAPIIRRLGGRHAEAREVVSARLPLRLNSERGRTEYVLVGLVESPAAAVGEPRYVAFPMGKGSGSVTTFSRADGFVVVPRFREYVDEDDVVAVHLLGRGLEPADLVVIGSHCIGLDFLLGKIQEQGFRIRFLAVGSSGGLQAAKRGECDLAGIHLLDPESNTYNRPFVSEELEWIPGYGRLQGIVFRPNDQRFVGKSLDALLADVVTLPDCIMVNRNRGSGTRVLIDRLLGDKRPRGYLTEARSHNAVAAAVAQQRADWGVAISIVAQQAGLGFLPVQEEHYDFVCPKARRHRPAVVAFCDLLGEPEVQEHLKALGMMLP
ncbi:MAG: molybdopterin biosynthesis protein [Gemmatales bacterium]|nr:MAG: molybdopterin biosynthesis protein [Gemmatales bacterium]